MAKTSRRRARKAVRLRRAGDLPKPASPPSHAPQTASLTVAERISDEAAKAIDQFADALARLRGLTTRLGCPSGVGKEEPKPCRAGRLGDIEDKIEVLRLQATVAAEQLSFIEQQI